MGVVLMRVKALLENVSESDTTGTRTQPSQIVKPVCYAQRYYDHSHQPSAISHQPSAISLWWAPVLLQYFLGKSGYRNVPGGAAARNVAVCGFASGIKRDLYLRAVNSLVSGARYEHEAITIQGESTYITMYVFKSSLKLYLTTNSMICRDDCKGSREKSKRLRYHRLARL